MPSKLISLRVKSEDLDKWRAHAKAERRSVANLISVAMEWWIASSTKARRAKQKESVEEMQEAENPPD